MDMRTHIATVVEVLHLNQDDFDLVSLHKHEAILVSILDSFTTLGKKGLSYGWWWEHFKGERFSIQTTSTLEIIAKLIPSDERAWFVFEDSLRTKKHGDFWLYEGKLAAGLAVIDELYGFEYYIVGKKFDWLLCENHHSVLISVGESINTKLKSLTVKTSSEALY